MDRVVLLESRSSSRLAMPDRTLSPVVSTNESPSPPARSKIERCRGAAVPLGAEEAEAAEDDDDSILALFVSIVLPLVCIDAIDNVPVVAAVVEEAPPPTPLVVPFVNGTVVVFQRYSSSGSHPNRPRASSRCRRAMAADSAIPMIRRMIMTSHGLLLWIQSRMQLVFQDLALEFIVIPSILGRVLLLIASDIPVVIHFPKRILLVGTVGREL